MADQSYTALGSSNGMVAKDGSTPYFRAKTPTAPVAIDKSSSTQVAVTAAKVNPLHG